MGNNCNCRTENSSKEETMQEIRSQELKDRQVKKKKSKKGKKNSIPNDNVSTNNNIIQEYNRNNKNSNCQNQAKNTIITEDENHINKSLSNTTKEGYTNSQLEKENEENLYKQNYIETTNNAITTSSAAEQGDSQQFQQQQATVLNKLNETFTIGGGGLCRQDIDDSRQEESILQYQMQVEQQQEERNQRENELILQEIQWQEEEEKKQIKQRELQQELEKLKQREQQQFIEEEQHKLEKQQLKEQLRSQIEWVDSKYFPIAVCLQVKPEFKSEVILSKIIEYNAKLYIGDYADFYIEKKQEMKLVQRLISVLKSQKQCAQFDNADLDIFKNKLLNWPPQFLTPVYDIFRHLALHIQCQRLFINNGLIIIENICTLLVNKELTLPFINLQFNLLINLMYQTQTSFEILEHSEQLLKALKTCLEQRNGEFNETVKKNISIFFLNFSIRFMQERNCVQKIAVDVFLDLLFSVGLEEKQEDNFLRYLICIAHLIIFQKRQKMSQAQQYINEEKLFIFKEQVSQGCFKGNLKIQECFVDLQRFFKFNSEISLVYKENIEQCKLKRDKDSSIIQANNSCTGKQEDSSKLSSIVNKNQNSKQNSENITNASVETNQKPVETTIATTNATQSQGNQNQINNSNDKTAQQCSASNSKTGDRKLSLVQGQKQSTSQDKSQLNKQKKSPEKKLIQQGNTPIYKNSNKNKLQVKPDKEKKITSPMVQRRQLIAEAAEKRQQQSETRGISKMGQINQQFKLKQQESLKQYNSNGQQSSYLKRYD